MKKLINDPADVVAESVAGFVAAHSDLVQQGPDPETLFISRRGGAVSGKVGLVSGGGSGHEPLHGGYVGKGMLDAAVPGAVFTSPTPDPILEATKAADGGAGVLHIVKNYTGDVLNFETAAELAEMDDIEVASVVVNDDVAVEDSLYTAGRRGVGGTVLVEKIAGAAAEAGADLARVAEVAQRVVDNVRSMGWPSRRARSPTRGSPPSNSVRMRSRSASASTASPVGTGSRWNRRMKSPIGSSTRSSPTSTSTAARRCCCSSTEWAARRSPSCTSSTATPGRAFRRRDTR